MITQTAMPPYPWQKKLWQGFCQNIAAGRLPHALLLGGVDGLGLEELGQSMARYLLCQNTLDDVACGRCRGCELLHAGSHPDFFQLKPEDGARQIKVDQVRDCVDFVAKTAHFDGPKLVLVEQAEAMNINAANALLKSLEEPAGRCVFILVSARSNAILPTIRSRCQCLNLALPSESSARAWLEEHGSAKACQFLRQAGGAPLKALAWAGAGMAEQQLALWQQLLELSQARLGAIALAGKWQGQDVSELIQMQQFLIESVIRQQLAAEHIPADLASLAAVLCSLEQGYLFRLHDKLGRRLQQLHGAANLNEQLQLEEMAMDWFSLLQLARRAQRR
ncbi:DNA polymerase III subunit delta' [Agaribacterium haliotis]|uniref:DNA polymerase III subunit delta' n=1 Tax=Agaribacterium haliotis TaxID=2013869 RepID=UPI000BB54B7E|nr:DNA polymerase III subunit delta' [Agaribacterium haliotis]